MLNFLMHKIEFYDGLIFVLFYNFKSSFLVDKRRNRSQILSIDGDLSASHSFVDDVIFIN